MKKLLVGLLVAVATVVKTVVGVVAPEAPRPTVEAVPLQTEPILPAAPVPRETITERASISRTPSPSIPGFTYTLIGTAVDSRTSPTAIFESAQARRVEFAQVRDQLDGWLIADIRLGEVVLLKDGVKRSLKVAGGGPRTLVREVSDHARMVDRQLLEATVRDAGLTTLWQQAVVLPEVNDGRIVGLRLHRVAQQSLARQLGLKEGDVITKVNGQPVDSLQNALALAYRLKQGLSDQPVIEVELQRPSGLKKLTYLVR